MDFKNVPNQYRPIPFWSWNEKLDTEETAIQIEEMEKQGIGGFFMHARGGLQTEYMSEEWFENVKVCADKCAEKGMHAWAYDENGWPSGFGGGLVNGLGIEYQQKYLRCERGGSRNENFIADVDGFRFYYDVNPFYVDTLDGKVIKCFIDKIYQPYYDKFKGGIDGFFTDEPQISRNGIPWSFILPEEYEKAYGEELIPHLPELFEDTGDFKNTRIKFWKLITELFSKNYMKQIYDWCTEHDYKFTGHLVLEESLLSQLYSNGACMPHYEYMSIPGMDWLGRHNRDSLTPYQVGSVARQTGKKQVLSETFALCGHNVGHDELKWIYEHQMVRGINLLCQHLEGYSNRGLRKRDYPPAMYIQQPWWKDYKMFNDAMSRIGMLLAGGDDGVDVLVIHPQSAAWQMYRGEIAGEPKGADESCADIEQAHNSLMNMLINLEKKHINFHLGDQIMIERHGRVEGNNFVIGEKKYTKVIIPDGCVLFENTDSLIEQFKANGGIVTTEAELPFNSIIDVPEITYCERHYNDFDMYYFVNSTEETFDAFIEKGGKVMDPVSGDLCDFDGHRVFGKYESLVVIDDRCGRQPVSEKKELTPVELGGEWEIVGCSENAVTLDCCDYWFDGVLQEKNGYILNAMYRAIDLARPVNIKCEYTFEAEYIPDNIFLVCETPEIFDIEVNGVKADKTDCGYYIDKSFRRINIAGYVKAGKNTITMTVDFEQSARVYENIEKGRKFESEKNKLTFDMELEQIYIVGDFGVKTPGKYEELDRNACRYSGKFVITEVPEKIYAEKIERQGFPFFVGDVVLRKTFEATSSEMMLDFVKCGINVVKAEINGAPVGQFMWEPFRADISGMVRKGKNEIELTLTNNLRNLQGPFHLSEGESYSVGPSAFYKEKCIWYPGSTEGRWNDDYCFVDVTIKNR